MHVGLKQLLKLRDGEDVGAAASAHAHECPQCHAELVRLTALTTDLRALPTGAPPPERWGAIQAALSGAARRRTGSRRSPGWLLPVASAALVLVTVLFTFSDRDHSGDSPDAAADDPGASGLDAARQELVAESQRLESLLASLPAEPRLTRAHTALTVADLEDRIQWVDYRLNLAHEAGLDGEPAERLWRERVDLLNSLVAVRYAEARTVAY